MEYFCKKFNYPLYEIETEIEYDTDNVSNIDTDIESESELESDIEIKSEL